MRTIFTVTVDMESATDRDLEAIDVAVEALSWSRAATVAGWGKGEDGQERGSAPVELIVDRGDPDEPQAAIRLFIAGVEVHPAQFHIDPGPGYTRSAWEEDRAAQVAAASSPEVADAVAHAFAGVCQAYIRDDT